jgi:hypothetical protein
MMEAVCTTETLVNFNVTTRRYITEDFRKEYVLSPRQYGSSVEPSKCIKYRKLGTYKPVTYLIPIRELSPILLDEIPGKFPAMFVHGD